MKSRVGIYAGTFNPVHSGHIGFALQAMERARLDKLYFLPERRSRHKREVEHFGHRVAMLRQALRPHPKFEVLELDDVSFSVARTLPKLQSRFHDAELIFLFGSDAVEQLSTWPQAEQMLKQAELVVGCRQGTSLQKVQQVVGGWPVQPRALTVFTSYAPQVSSGRVRQALRLNRPASGLLKSVARYSERNWLYVSLSRPATVDKP